MPFEVVLATIIWILIPIIGLSIYLSQKNKRKKLNPKPTNFFITFWTNSFDFRSKTKRKTFWITQFCLYLQYLYVVIYGLLLSLAINSTYGKWYSYRDFQFEEWTIIRFLLLVFSVITFVPQISLIVRRLRDASRSPFWVLISIIPFGGIILLIFLCKPSRKKKLPITLQDRLDKVEVLLSQGTIDKEEYKFMRKEILSKYVE
jgi:uncharacterized membrane protein YhaH (DUF805 family)